MGPAVVPIANNVDIPVPARDMIARLMMQYVHAIDNDELERFPEFFCETCLYKVQPRTNFERGLPLATWLSE